MKDIEIINSVVIFRKQLWHESEIILAKCLNFHVNHETLEISCSIPFTSKRAIYEFIKIAFKSFNESPAQESRRNAFFSELDSIYIEMDRGIQDVLKQKLPYYHKLYSHQRDTISEAFYKKHNFLALDMGLGKTLISASISRSQQVRRTVIVCPAVVKWNWFRDLVAWGFNELYFSICDTRKSRNIRALQERFVIVNYDIVGKFVDEISSDPVGHFIFDESHYLKNHNSNRFKMVNQLVSSHPDAKVTFLSGTPVKNRVNDIFAYLKLTGHELGNNYKKFVDTYTIQTSNRGGSQARVTGGRNLNDLHVKLSNFMIRKTKEECLDLPGKIFFQYKFEMDDYRSEYNKVIDELAQLKEISSLTGNLHSLNIITAKAKIKGVVELAENIIDQGKKVVIFGSYRDPLNQLKKHFGDSCVLIDGSVDSFTRDQHVQRFWNDETCTVFIGNMQAAGVGINLTNASDVIFINFPFTPAELYQATDRCDRIGQKSSVNIHYTFCEGSIDEYIYEIIVDKERDINTLIDRGKETMERGNITEILIKKLLNKKDA